MRPSTNRSESSKPLFALPPLSRRWRSVDLLVEADLLHERLIIPEEVLLVHYAVLPVANGADRNLVRLARGRDGLAAADGHGLRERPFHNSDYRGPLALAHLDRVDLDPRVGIDEHRLEVLDVLLDTAG
jgi:hypothetical protein